MDKLNISLNEGAKIGIPTLGKIAGNIAYTKTIRSLKFVYSFKQMVWLKWRKNEPIALGSTSRGLFRKT